MSERDDAFLAELRAVFTIEADEHLHAISTGVLELERSSAPAAQARLIETVFRAAHSLKGAARSVDFTEIESACQQLEDVFAGWNRKEDVPTPESFNAVYGAIDSIHAALTGGKAPDGARPASESSFMQSVRESESSAAAKAVADAGKTPAAAQSASAPVAPSVPISSIAAASPAAPATPLPPKDDASPAQKTVVAAADGTVRISVSKLDERLVEAENMLTAKLTTAQRVDDLQDLEQRFDEWKNEWARIEPDVRALRQTTQRLDQSSILDFLAWNFEFVKTLDREVSLLARRAEQDHYAIGKLVDDLLADSKKLLLLPFATLVAPFPKLVRDLCRDQGKEADLAIFGEDVEIDKRILEQMKDPLIHLLRNCIDHGIEKPDVRVQHGKPARATITLTASAVNGSKVEILISDDGAGIDVEKVKASALKRGILSANDAPDMDKQAAMKLIFQAEVSTSPIITRLSGRGLGLAIVRENAEKLGGSVSVDSQPGKNTQFRIVLPSMLATFRGILIEVEKRTFVVPTVHVERVASVPKDGVRTVEGRETIELGGHVFAWVHLADVLELPLAERRAAQPAVMQTVILGFGDERIAFAIDAVLDEQEVLVKPLRKPLSRVCNIAGATVLGSGQVAPVLNVVDLLKSARKIEGTRRRDDAGAETKATVARSILVAEDSITSRMLIKTILESSGYKVKTAVDGLEAFALLRAEKFDLIVSDVEMPRLNGFDLAARIRADANLAELPIILVTALETREDRERGIDVGGSAYIIKSSFDQSNLLDAVRRLI